MQDEYRTLAGRSRYEPEKIKGSRFIASLAPAVSPAAAEAFVAETRAEFSDARHTCFAWRIGCGDARTRSDDDGEPSGSAGRPIAQQIEGHEVTDVVIAVTRYFGGVKLGVGGLMRAYGGAAGQALDRAEIRTVLVTEHLELTYPYDCSGPVQGLLASEGLEPAAAAYGESVRIEVQVPVARVAAFLAELGERTAGRALVRTR